MMTKNIRILQIISIFILLFFAFKPSFCQTEIDSLEKNAETLMGEKKVEAFNALSWKLRNSQPQRALKYAQAAIVLSELRNYEKLKLKALSFAGVAEKNLGNYLNSLTYYFEALKIAEKRNYKAEIAYSKINIANIYIYQQEYHLAIPPLQEALKVATQIANKEIIGYANLNLGRVFSNLANFEKALFYFNTALKLRSELNDTEGISVCLKYIGDVYYAKSDIEKALKHYFAALSIAKNSKLDTDLMSDAYNKIARCYLNQNKIEESEKAALESYAFANEINSILRLREASFTLFEIYNVKKNYKNSLDYYQKYITFRDTLTNVQNIKQITQLQEKHKYEKENEIKQLEAENKQLIIDEKFKIERNKQYFLYAFALILLVFLGVVIKHNITRRKANESLRLQRDTIAKQNEEIRDSILYAARIQTAVLPPLSEINKFFPENFILYLPRNIVSGDFYWAKALNFNGKNYLIIVAADCTGHGVPGAFMSMLGIAFLNGIVSETAHLNILTSNEILNRLRDKVISSLNQSGKENETKDGMDISLCVIDLETKIMQFSGAYNSMFLAREGEIIKIDADKMPIGVYPRQIKDFTKREIQLQKNDRIYLFSDGYPDQFGGETKQKFLIKNFRQLILENYLSDMEKQKEILKSTFEAWKGQSKQLDDILVMGIKIE